MQGWYCVKSLTGQRRDRVQTESQQLQPWTAVSTLLGFISWSTDIHILTKMVMICCSFLTWFSHDFLRDSLCLSAVTLSRHDVIFWIFPIVPYHAFCRWHWPIGKDLDLSFIWGYHHLSEYMDISRPADEAQQGRNSCPRLQLLAFSLDSITSLPR